MKRKLKYLIFAFFLIVALYAILRVYKYYKWKKYFSIEKAGNQIIPPAGEQINQEFYFDFENSEGLLNTEAFSNEMFHSGKTSSCQKGKDSYSVTIIKQVKDVPLNTSTDVRIQAWLYSESKEIETSIVFSIEDTTSKKSLYWDGVPVKENNFPVKTWTMIDRVISIPKEKYKEENIIKIYFWNTGSSKFFADNLKILFVKSSPKTYILNDMEAIDYLPTECPHSGLRSSKLDGKDQYCPGINTFLSYFDLKDKKYFDISAWLWSKNRDVYASYVLEIHDTITKKIISWNKVDIKSKDFKTGEWVRIYSAFPAKKEFLKPEYKLKAYIWNRNDNTIFLDDLFIRLREENNTRKGNSFLHDLVAAIPKKTESGFVYYNKPLEIKENVPPYNVKLFEKINVKGISKTCLVAEKNKTGTDLLKADFIVSGNFIDPEDERDEICVFANNELEIYKYIPAEQKFVSVPVKNNSMSTHWVEKIVSVKKINADDDNTDELFITTNDGFYLLKINSDKQISAIWNCKKNNEEFNDNCQIISGKFSDETREQLMLIQKDGTWKIVSFEKNKWIELFKGKVEEWVSKNSKSSFHFIEKDRRILCIKENLISKNSDYFMHSFLPFGTLKSAFQNNDNKGLLNSMDTLKTTDFYISLKAGIIRLNRDWRFDLKEIIFNEKGFVINNTIDFTAYTADQNPKFYESSVIVPGNYFEPLKPALMVLSGNKKKDILPDVLQFFKVE